MTGKKKVSAKAQTPTLLTGKNFQNKYDTTETLYTALSEIVQKYPDLGIVYIDKNGKEVKQSYDDLLKKAHAYRDDLRKKVGKNQYILLCFLENQDLIEAFWTCQALGLIPIPMAPPSVSSKSDEAMRRLLNICKRYPYMTLLIDDHLFDGVSAQINDEVTIYKWSSIEKTPVEKQKKLKLNPSKIAMVQFSSGSTSEPKGIALSHQNILINAQQMILAIGRTSGPERFVSWMPLYHDMGIIGYHITPLVAKSSQVLIPSRVFIKNPLIYLTALSEFKCTCTGLTNFAVRMLTEYVKKNRAKVEQKKLSFRSIVSLVIGAEPISFQALTDFRELLAPYGLHPKSSIVPAYGMAEAGLCVTFTKVVKQIAHPGYKMSQCSKNSAHHPQLVSLGCPVPGLQLRIMDEKKTLCSEGEIGEIWINGPNLFLGYLIDAGLQERKEAWYATGDYGCIVAGELYFSGRMQDMVNVNGRNYFLTDIELVVSDLDFARPSAISAVCDVDELIVFVDCQKARSIQQGLQAVKTQIQRMIGITPDKIIHLNRRRFSYTTTGKLQRLRLYERYKSGDFEDCEEYKYPMKSNAKDNALTMIVAQAWSEAIGRPIDAMDYDSEFSDLGGTSLQVVNIHTMLEKTLGKAVSPKLLFNISTINKMVKALEESFGAPSQEKNQAKVEVSTLSNATPVNQSDESYDPVVIVGYGCTYPMAEDPSQFWELLLQGKNNITRRSAKRTLLGRYYNQLRSQPSGHSPLGSFLQGIDLFDSDYFGLSHKQAKATDPQHRLFLQVLEQVLGSVRISSTNVGVFAACSDSEYKQQYLLNAEALSEYALLGSLPNMVSALISQLYGFTGPSVEVSTACSSSLFALHQAIQSINNNDCDVAIVGGVHLHLSDQCFDYFRQAGILSEDRVAKPFNEETYGLVPGEGAALVILKKLSKAKQDGNQIHAVINKTVVNNDGRTISGTAPNPKEKIALLKKAYSGSTLNLSKIDYVEAHATGTKVGDAVEVLALQQAFEELEPENQKKIPIGSVKSNIGHTMSTAGVSGLIKVLLCMKHNTLVPTMFCENPASIINFPNTHFFPVSQSRDWPAKKSQRRYAAINSFGLGGTNVHLVIEDYENSDLASSLSNFIQCLSVGGYTRKGWLQRKNQLVQLLMTNENMLDDIQASSILSDQFKPYRAVIFYQDNDEFLCKLKELQVPNRCMINSNVVLVYSQCASQYSGYFKILYEKFAVFKEVIDHCHAVLSRHKYDLRKAIFSCGDVWLDRTSSFAFCFAVEQTLRSLGCVPIQVIDYNFGGLASSVFSGDVNFDQALQQLIRMETSGADAKKDFELSLEAVLRAGVDNIVHLACQAEVSDHLSGLSQEHIDVSTYEIFEHSDDQNYLVNILAKLYKSGVPLQLERLTQYSSMRLLPAPYQLKHTWLELKSNHDVKTEVSLALNTSSHYSFVDHKIKGKYSAPFSYVIDEIYKVLLQAGLFQFSNIALEDIFLQTPFYIEENGTTTLAVVVDNVDVTISTKEKEQQLKCKVLENKRKVFSRIDLDGIKSRCVKGMSPEKLFNQRRSAGLDIGSSMQAINSITYNENEVLVSLHNTSQAQSGADFMLSTALLDSVMQACSVFAQCESNDLYLGFGIDRVELYDELKSNMFAYMILDPRSSVELLRCDIIFSTVDGYVLGIIKGFSARHVVPAIEHVNISESKQVSSISFSGIREALDFKNQNVVNVENFNSYADGCRAIEILSLEYVSNAFLSMGWEFKIGDVFTKKLLLDRLGIIKKYSQLLDRLLVALSDAQVIQQMNGHWLVLKELSVCGVDDHHKSLIDRYPHQEGDAILLQQTASQLAGVLSGDIDPLSLLFSSQALKQTQHVYQKTLMSQFFSKALHQLSGYVVRNIYDNTAINFIEIGAGTGGTTLPILQSLNGRLVNYDFTDKSKYFLSEARKQFDEYDFVRYKELDIELSPIEQGYAAGDYDVVVASNVLHATRNIKDALRHIMQLLKPNGLLVLVELTQKSLWLDLTFGLTDGWWRFDQDELRQDYPLLSPNQWLEVCRSVGFNECMVIDDYKQSLHVQDGFVQSLFCLRSPTDTMPKNERSENIIERHQDIQVKKVSDRKLENADVLEKSLDNRIVERVESVIHKKIRESDLNEHFTNLGIDSLDAITISEALQKEFNIDLSNTIIFESETIGKLVKVVKNRLANMEKVYEL